ncbi:MAG: hypothetical protein ACKODT_07090 [Fluviibacter sp.]
MERNKAAVLASGLDPELKRLRRLQAIKSAQAKKFTKACESIERYWDQVHAAIMEKES